MVRESVKCHLTLQMNHNHLNNTENYFIFSYWFIHCALVKTKMDFLLSIFIFFFTESSRSNVVSNYIDIQMNIEWKRMTLFKEGKEGKKKKHLNGQTIFCNSVDERENTFRRAKNVFMLGQWSPNQQLFRSEWLTNQHDFSFIHFH